MSSSALPNYPDGLLPVVWATRSRVYVLTPALRQRQSRFGRLLGSKVAIRVYGVLDSPQLLQLIDSEEPRPQFPKPYGRSGCIDSGSKEDHGLRSPFKA